MKTSCGIAALTVACLLLSLLSGCASQVSPSTTLPSEETTCQTEATTKATVPTQPVTTAPLPTETEAEETTAAVATTEETVPKTEAPTEPTHSEFYIPGLEVDDLIAYFNEVCLDAEFSTDGNPNVVQRWEVPIYYMLYGEYTPEDLEMLTGFTRWLNTMEGFPGIHETTDPVQANLQIHFCTEDMLLDIMGENFIGCDGGVTFWYDDNAIYNANICYRTDIHQYLRNSVILEEIYNGLGPVQDTWLREDSIIYAGFSQPQALTQVDELILRLLYHPMIQRGMDAAECEAVIRQLYY